MTQPVEALLPVTQGSGPLQLRMLNFVIAQPDGTFKTVSVEPTVLLDPNTGQYVIPMSFDQANDLIARLDTLIELQKKLLGKFNST